MQIDLSQILQLLSTVGGPWGVAAAVVAYVLLQRRAKTPTPAPTLPAPDLVNGFLSQLIDLIHKRFPNLPVLPLAAPPASGSAADLVAKRAEIDQQIQQRVQFHTDELKAAGVKVG